jgi:hypothetical protein
MGVSQKIDLVDKRKHPRRQIPPGSLFPSSARPIGPGSFVV